MDCNSEKHNNMHQMMKKVWNWMKDNRSLLGSISSIVLSIATLVISFFMLKVANSSLASAEQSRMIAEQSLILSSKEYTPSFEIEINHDSGFVFINNPIPTLYTIVSVEITDIKRLSFNLDSSGYCVGRYFFMQTNYKLYEIPWWKKEVDTSTVIINLINPKKLYYDSIISLIDNCFWNTILRKRLYEAGVLPDYKPSALYEEKLFEPGVGKLDNYYSKINYRDHTGKIHSTYYLQYIYGEHSSMKQVISEEQYYSDLMLGNHNEIDSMTEIDSIMDYIVINSKADFK